MGNAPGQMKKQEEEVLEMLQRILSDPVGAFRMVKTTLTKLGWAELRPWKEFWQSGEFKRPSNLEDRVTTNFIYYRSNYVIVVIGALILSVMSCPTTIVMLLIGLVASALALVLSENTGVAATVLGLTALISGRRLLLGLLVGLVLVLLHVVFRTRSIRSRLSATIDEHRINH